MAMQRIIKILGVFVRRLQIRNGELVSARIPASCVLLFIVYCVFHSIMSISTCLIRQSTQRRI